MNHLTQAENALRNQSAAAIIGGQFNPAERIRHPRARLLPRQCQQLLHGMRGAEQPLFQVIERLLPRLVAARGFGDADDIAAVLHYRVERATGRPAGSGRTRKPPRLIAGLIPQAHGVIDVEMRAALDERVALIEARTDAVLAEADCHMYKEKVEHHKTRHQHQAMDA